MRLLGVLSMSAALALPLAARAQESTLADIRQQLAVVYADLQSLRSELNTTGAPQAGATGNTALERLDALEAQVQRLTSRAEELDYRINRVVTDGTNRIGDLEFRICELEPGCEIGALGDTPSLGGVDIEAQIPQPEAPPPSDGPTLAVNEQADFDAAKAALDAGNSAEAADLFGQFVSNYPGGPLSAQALYFRGQALEATGDLTTAARAYLEAFSGAPDGSTAPDALYKLGATLAQLGQVQDACITLNEVGTRFPGSPAEGQAQAMMTSLSCS
ncbi:tol-pal system protein YbgF [Wenxinia marina]|nr:tol-pal system protein YbgF [Wenxinia marina]